MLGRALGKWVVGEAGDPLANEINSLAEKCGDNALLNAKGNFEPSPHLDILTAPISMVRELRDSGQIDDARWNELLVERPELAGDARNPAGVGLADDGGVNELLADVRQALDALIGPDAPSFGDEWIARRATYHWAARPWRMKLILERFKALEDAARLVVLSGVMTLGGREESVSRALMDDLRAAIAKATTSGGQS
jgi:hypothetical protein